MRSTTSAADAPTPTLRALVGLVLVGLVLAGLVLAGCSASAAPEPTPSPTRGPLGTYLSILYGDQDAAEEQARADAAQELIARCMADDGFEYTPDTGDLATIDDGSWPPDDPEWVAQWGYGIVTWPGQTDEERSSTGASPNTDYLDSLNPVARDAWFATLYGPPAAEAETSPSWDEQGCWGAAMHEVSGDDPLQTDANQPLRQAIEDFYAEQFDADEYVPLNAEWSDCMADAGRSGFPRQVDADLSIRSAITDYYAGLEGDAPDTRDLDALHDSEVELALVDLDCRIETDYGSRSLAIQHAQEEQFVADHREELDELVAGAEAGR